MQIFAHKETRAEETQIETLPSFSALLIASILGALGGVAFAMLLFGFAYREEFSTMISEVSKTGKIENTAPVEEIENKPAVLNSEEYMNAFVWTTRVRLEDLGLGKSLKVSSTPDGKILIRGALLPNHLGRYNIFKGWFQSRESYPPLVDEVSFIKTSGLFPKIRSVWLGDEPTIHLANGKNAKVGSTFGDGWTVVEIGRLAMTLERNGTIIELSYEDS